MYVYTYMHMFVYIYMYKCVFSVCLCLSLTLSLSLSLYGSSSLSLCLSPPDLYDTLLLSFVPLLLVLCFLVLDAGSYWCRGPQSDDGSPQGMLVCDMCGSYIHGVVWPGYCIRLWLSTLMSLYPACAKGSGRAEQFSSLSSASLISVGGCFPLPKTP